MFTPVFPRFFVFLAVVALVGSQTPAQAAGRDFEKLEQCHLIPNPANDGDSFHVRHEGKEFIFRLYLVDTPETEATFPERVQEQAAYFDLKPDEALRIGKIAQAFTHNKLAGKPFTVFTRWQDAKGASRLPRYYAHVVIEDKLLSELLVANGLARIFGMPANTPTGMTASAFNAHLRTLEAKAKADHLGGWSAHSAKTAAPAADSWSSMFAPHATPSPSPALR